ncbi:MAG: hypothetical protein M1840_001683 [Geoglossum simile]|nr:MAG: hypothetical protein M1840_001683 [Geoglossum simile]
MPFTPGISLEALAERLEQTRGSKNPAAYETFVQELDKAVQEMQALKGGNVSSEPASRLTENEVFEYFKLENERREAYSVVKYDIPQYSIRAVQNMIPLDLEFSVSTRLDENLAICTKTFDTRSEQFTRTAISLILMEVVHIIHQYQENDLVRDDVSGPGGPTLSTLQPPNLMARPITPEGDPQAFPRKPLKNFSEYATTYKLQYDGSVRTIGGRFDLAVGYDGGNNEPTPLSALLFVAELKNTQKGLDEAFPQLLAYMAMTYRTRQRQLKRNHNVYGLITNWLSWQFVMIENNIVHKSNVLSVADNLPLIVQFLGRTLLASALQTSTSSPYVFRRSGGEASGNADGGLHIGDFQQSVLGGLFEYEVVDVSMD